MVSQETAKHWASGKDEEIEAEGPGSCTSRNFSGFRDRAASLPEQERLSLVGRGKRRPPR